MRISPKRLAIVGALVTFAAVAGWTLVGATSPSAADFKSDDAIETLQVKIDVGADGEDLAEPVALDLGLGFPLWLHPLGRGAEEPAPFGAVAQEASERGRVAAGSSATFTFRLKGDASQDAMQATPQLLAGVRVADIARVGFASIGRSNWSLAGYEIVVNGKPFASGKPAAAAAPVDAARLAEVEGKIAAANKEVAELQDLVKAGLATDADRARLADAEAVQKTLLAERNKLAGPGTVVFKAKAAQDAARQRLVEVNQKIAPVQTERADLAELARTGLATADDRQRLDDATASLAQLNGEKARLEGQLQGVYPWFEDREFRSPWRGPASIQSARVTLLTQSHAGADARNFVYLRTGGRKYLLGSPATPLSAAAGPQTFALDLVAGPLAAADVRGWALGMIGQPEPYGKAPDRWHPQRLVVEIDGRVVYDSDANDLDRRSLEAIRLIPPAHRDHDGQIIANTPLSRETFLWEAGKGAGLDATGGVLPLPPATDPSFPPAEPGLPEQPVTPPADPAIPPFPGEIPLPPDDVVAPIGGWFGINWGTGGFGFGWGPGGWWPGPWGPGGGWGPGLANLLLQLWQQLGWLPPPLWHAAADPERPDHDRLEDRRHLHRHLEFGGR